MTEAAVAGFYALALRWGRLAEPPPEPLNEAELSLIWQGQRFPAEALRTPDGRAVRVLNPGRLNAGPGPDFRDAVLELDGQERRGDVELHVRASFFRTHGHHTDPAYAGLALHVVYRADDGLETPLSGGAAVPVAAFAPWLEQRTGDLQGWLSSPPLWREPCQDAVSRLGAQAVESALVAAGRARFQMRRDYLAAQAAQLGADEALWRALLDGLGVGGDRDGFRRLALSFPARLARELCQEDPPAAAPQRLEQALLRVAGLGPEGLRSPESLPAPLHPAIGGSGRPANHPGRRLAAAARLLQRAEGRLAQYALTTLRRAETPRSLLSFWQVGAGDGRSALLGRGRAQELLVNLVLPFAATLPELATRAESLLEQLGPLPPYGKTAFLEANLRRPDGRRLVRGAVGQQGLLAYLAEWCSQGGCGRCPLS